MSDQSETQKLNINPAFKKQLLLLKKAAAEELKIQVSLDKMVNDKQYRNTFLNELDGLGTESFNALVDQLKRIPVYAESTPLSQTDEPESVASKSEPAKQKKSVMPVIVTLIVILLIGFSAWKTGYLNSSSEKAVQSVQAPVKAVVAPVERKVEVVKEEPKIEKEITLPSDNSIVSLRFDGSNSMSGTLIPALLEAYLRKQGITKMKWLLDTEDYESELQYIDDKKVFSVKVQSHGSSMAFKALLNEQADFGLSSRKISDEEIELLRPKFGNLSLARSEFVVGLDGIAVIVNPENPIKSLTNEMLAKVFSGEITNWSELGGEDAQINVYSRDDVSGTAHMFTEIVLEANNVMMTEQATHIKSSSELSEEVADDIDAIGFVPLTDVHDSKKIAIAASEETESLYPTRFTVSTEDYLLARRLFMYMPASVNPFVKGFSKFVTSVEGQEIVEDTGLISQNIKLEKAHIIPNAPKSYNDYVNSAQRVNVDFRFKSGSNDLDNKGKRDIKRLVEYISKNPSYRIALMGFSDSLGEPSKNRSLSLIRARELEKELNSYGVDVGAIEAYGAAVPISSNKSALGRSKNRRVEVWIF